MKLIAELYTVIQFPLSPPTSRNLQQSLDSKSGLCHSFLFATLTVGQGGESTAHQPDRGLRDRQDVRPVARYTRATLPSH